MRIKETRKCLSCGKGGHIASVCYLNQNQREERKNEFLTRKTNTYNNQLITQTKNAHGSKIFGKLEKLESELKYVSDTLKKHFEIIPKKFDALKTILSNSIFAYEILKCLGCKKLNSINIDKWVMRLSY